MDRLYEPPDALLALDRGALEGLRGALTRIRASSEGMRGDLPEQRVETA
jgi:hypothetical protein